MVLGSGHSSFCLYSKCFCHFSGPPPSPPKIYPKKLINFVDFLKNQLLWVFFFPPLLLYVLLNSSLLQYLSSLPCASSGLSFLFFFQSCYWFESFLIFMGLSFIQHGPCMMHYFILPEGVSSFFLLMSFFNSLSAETLLSFYIFVNFLVFHMLLISSFCSPLLEMTC